MPRYYPREVYWSQARKLASLDEKLRVRVAGILQALEAQGYEPHIVYGWRSASTQDELCRAGYSRTMQSLHLYDPEERRYVMEGEALAVDIIDSNLGWTPDADEFFAALGELAHAEGLTWGGDWPGFRDASHIEWRPADD